MGRPRSGDDGKERLRTLDLRLTVEMKDQLQAAGQPMIATIRAALDSHLARQSNEPLTPIWGETLTSSKAELRASVVRAVHEEAERRGGSAAGVVREALAEWFAGREGGG
jgi:inactivated superfamily I helicase